MALINCPECKERVSEYAAFCPHCGRPNPSSDRSHRRKTLWVDIPFSTIVFGVLFGLILFGVLIFILSILLAIFGVGFLGALGSTAG